MNRTRAQALALVNWNGVFYERYLLDRHVTALEGTNGAGKTTVMIAAYVVLLPDMSRLRFTNVGESGATGGDKGIWGRLGEPGRPSYAVIDFALADRGRLIAGVHMERKGEPSVEPTPFIIWGLADGVRTQDLLLVSQGDSEVVPELPELRENAARLGGRLQVFPSARDYFAALFDQGVTPLRLSTDEERSKLNEMLRASMTGGISKALTSELRAFLLKEESGLADTLQRMRANLDACRRTRIEVQESRRLEREIGGVFEAGQIMFAAAFLSTRERAGELERRVAEAETALIQAIEAQAAAETALARTTSELELVNKRRQQIQEKQESAREWHTRVSEAHTAANALATRTGEVNVASQEAARAKDVRDEAERTRNRKREELHRAQDNYERAAGGLADIQQGIQELHRRAGAYHQVARRLREAEDALDVPEVSADALEEIISRAEADLHAVDRERRQKSTRLADADDDQQQHAEVLAALSSLTGAEIAIEHSQATAIEALRRYRDQAALATHVASIAGTLVETRRIAEHQAAARDQARELDITISREPAGLVIQSLLGKLEAERGDYEEKERSARTSTATAEHAARELETQRRALTAREPEWREYAERATRLSAHIESAVDDRASLDRARATVNDSLSSTQRAEDSSREKGENLAREARELIASGGPFSPELLRLKDALNADLLAAGFEDVALSEAGLMEARLGLLAQALVVDDPQLAARAIGSRPETLGDVLLVPRDANIEEIGSEAPQIEFGSTDVVVNDGLAVRVSRIPLRPRLGRRAREARAAELRSEAENLSRQADQLRAKRRYLERLLSDADSLLAGHTVWLAGDPATELAEVNLKLVDTATQIEAFRTTATQQAGSALALRPRIDNLRNLLSEALLLDPPDYEERLRLVEQQHESACAAQAEVARVSHLAEIVDRKLAVLRTAPLSADEITTLRYQVEELRRQRERLDAAVDALKYVRLNSEALGWSEAPNRLAESQALVPALQGQLSDAKEDQEVAGNAERNADQNCQHATSIWQDADGKLKVASQTHQAALRHFESFSIPAPSEDAVRNAGEEVMRLEGEWNTADEQRDKLLTTHGRQEGECARAQQLAKERDEKLGSERREADPAVARWQKLRERAARYKVSGSVPGLEQADLKDVRGHVNFVQSAQTHRTLLLERLEVAQGASTLVAELKVLRDTSDADFGEGVLDLWLTVRDWLRRRLPAQIAEVDDPREGLLRLRDQLSSLEERLNRQENDLRGASEDVARGIDVQIRKARGQVNRLTKNLEGVSFGSIRAIRVRLEPVDRMEQVLRALRDGSVQGILFQQDIPIEEALDEIFRRYGGGRSGGHRLLDYREYVSLQVEIRRKAGSDWETANPTRLSTGEAIGVGAALMMVVLTEWERDSTLLRGKRSYGSLRFLFLDEANRLSHDNLGVLFDLCQTLDLQLLIAAPEVARAEGNTTYRLVRRITTDGREEVIVSGRRTRTEG